MAKGPKVTIKVKSFVADIRNGASDKALVEKYTLTEAMLPKIFDQLIAGGHITEDELTNRTFFESTQDVMDLFTFPGPKNFD